MTRARAYTAAALIITMSAGLALGCYFDSIPGWIIITVALLGGAFGFILLGAILATPDS